MSWQIERVHEAAISKYRKQGKREGLSFVPNTEYALLRVEGCEAGFCGIRWYPKKAVFRNLFVLSEYRGQGYGSKLIQYQINRAKELNRLTAVAYTNWNSLKLYVAAGGLLNPSKRFYGLVTFDLNNLQT